MISETLKFRLMIELLDEVRRLTEQEREALRMASEEHLKVLGLSNELAESNRRAAHWATVATEEAGCNKPLRTRVADLTARVKTLEDALKSVVSLDFTRNENGERNLYNGAPKFVEAWLLCDQVLATKEPNG